MFLQLSGTDGALPKNTQPFLKILPKNTQQSPACRTGDSGDTAGKHRQNPKTSPIKPPPSSPRHTRSKKQKWEIQIPSQDRVLPAGRRVLSPLREVFTHEESFLFLEQTMEWRAPGKGRGWRTLHDSQTVLSQVIHVIHLQLTSSSPRLGEVFFLSAWRSQKGFSAAEKTLKTGWGKKAP